MPITHLHDVGDLVGGDVLGVSVASHLVVDRGEVVTVATTRF